jgi:hypothetical protein
VLVGLGVALGLAGLAASALVVSRRRFSLAAAMGSMARLRQRWHGKQ